MTSRITSEVSTSKTTAGQRKQLDRFLADAAENANLDKHGLQRVIERGGELQESLTRILKDLSAENQFADERVDSKTRYPSDFRFKTLDEQIKTLQRLFPEIGRPNLGLLQKIKDGKVTLPKGAESWLAIPHWSQIGSTYAEAVEIVKDLLNRERNGKFNKYLHEQLGSKYLIETPKKARLMDELQRSQNEGIGLVPVQFGLCYSGYSARNALASMGPREFGFGFYEFAIAILIHPHLLSSHNALRFDCGGDIYRIDTSADLEGVLQFDYVGGWMGISFHKLDSVVDQNGSPSAFTL